VRPCLKKTKESGCWWLTSIILATQEAEICRIAAQSQPRHIVLENLSQKNSSHKGAGVMAQVVGPEFKPQYRKKKKGKILTPLIHMIIQQFYVHYNIPLYK
jgi:hypothetical protein